MQYEKYVERYLKKVREEVREPNRSLIIDFVAQERAEKRSEARILDYLRKIYEMEKILGKPFRKAERRDIVRIVNKIEAKDTKIRFRGNKRVKIKGKLSESHKLGYKVTIKKFWKWLNGGEEYPESVRWIKCTSRKMPGLKEEDILTPEEVSSIIKKAKFLRDRCLIALTYETGARLGEIHDLRRKDVEFMPEGAIIHITNEKYNKGEKRHVPVVYCVSDLMNYLESMPEKDPESYLWIGIRGSKVKGRIDKNSFNGIFKRASAKAGINKRVWVHGLRHSRVSHVKDKLTEQVQKEIFGWSPKSDMVGHYGKISKKQAIDSVFSNVYGIKNGNGENGTACPRCKALMRYETDKCWRCGQILDEKKLIQERNLEAEMGKLEENMALMAKFLKRAYPEKWEAEMKRQMG